MNVPFASFLQTILHDPDFGFDEAPSKLTEKEQLKRAQEQLEEIIEGVIAASGDDKSRLHRNVGAAVMLEATNAIIRRCGFAAVPSNAAESMLKLVTATSLSSAVFARQLAATTIKLANMFREVATEEDLTPDRAVEIRDGLCSVCFYQASIESMQFLTAVTADYVAQLQRLNLSNPASAPRAIELQSKLRAAVRKAVRDAFDSAYEDLYKAVDSIQKGEDE